MPTAAFRACAEPGCPAILRQGGRCAAHARPAWGGATRPNRYARGYDAEYQRNRKTVLAEESHCWLFHEPGEADDQADHITPLLNGGTNQRENMRRAHRRCNHARGSAQGAKSTRVRA